FNARERIRLKDGALSAANSHLKERNADPVGYLVKRRGSGQLVKEGLAGNAKAFDKLIAIQKELGIENRRILPKAVAQELAQSFKAESVNNGRSAAAQMEEWQKRLGPYQAQFFYEISQENLGRNGLGPAYRLAATTSDLNSKESILDTAIAGKDIYEGFR